MEFNRQYYEKNRQLGDRPALWFYSRLARYWFAPGPVLDFGCGMGFLLRRLARYGPAAGLETSAYCRVNLGQTLPDVPLYDTADKLPNKWFSGVVALHVFEHLADGDLERTLERLSSSLRPGGRVLCAMPDAGGRGHRLKGSSWSGFRDPTHVNLKSSAEWAAFFSQNGWRVVKTGTDGLWDFPYSKERPVWLDQLHRAWGTLFQFLLGRLVLPAGWGESVIFLLQKEWYGKAA